MTFNLCRITFNRAGINQYRNQNPNYRYTEKYSAIDLLQLVVFDKKTGDILRCPVQNIKDTDHAFVVKICKIKGKGKATDFKFVDCGSKQDFISLCTHANYPGYEHVLICGIKNNNTERIILVNRGAHHKNVIDVSNNNINETDIDIYVANHVPANATLSVLYVK